MKEGEICWAFRRERARRPRPRIRLEEKRRAHICFMLEGLTRLTMPFMDFWRADQVSSWREREEVEGVGWSALAFAASSAICFFFHGGTYKPAAAVAVVAICAYKLVAMYRVRMGRLWCRNCVINTKQGRMACGPERPKRLFAQNCVLLRSLYNS